MILASIDPGKRWQGVAEWTSGVLSYAALVDMENPPAYRGADRVALEKMVYRPQVKNSIPSSLIAVAESGGQLAGSYRCPVDLVPAHTWKGTIPKDVCHRRTLRILTAPEVALLESVLKATRRKSNHKEILDAVGIGLFSLKRAIRGMIVR